MTCLSQSQCCFQNHLVVSVLVAEKITMNHMKCNGIRHAWHPTATPFPSPFVTYTWARHILITDNATITSLVPHLGTVTEDCQTCLQMTRLGINQDSSVYLRTCPRLNRQVSSGETIWRVPWMVLQNMPQCLSFGTHFTKALSVAVQIAWK